jgi:hypothetical protein
VLITDHYRVQDWEALSLALSDEADIEGSRLLAQAQSAGTGMEGCETRNVS